MFNELPLSRVVTGEAVGVSKTLQGVFAMSRNEKAILLRTAFSAFTVVNCFSGGGRNILSQTRANDR